MALGGDSITMRVVYISRLAPKFEFRVFCPDSDTAFKISSQFPADHCTFTPPSAEVSEVPLYVIKVKAADPNERDHDGIDFHLLEAPGVVGSMAVRVLGQRLDEIGCPWHLEGEE